MSVPEACSCHLYTAPVCAVLLGTIYPPCSTTLFLNRLHLSIPSTLLFLPFICFLVTQLKSLCCYLSVVGIKMPWSRRKSLWFQCIWLGGMAARSKCSNQRRMLKDHVSNHKHDTEPTNWQVGEDVNSQGPVAVMCSLQKDCTSLYPPQKVPPTEGQVFKFISLREPFSFKPSHSTG